MCCFFVGGRELSDILLLAEVVIARAGGKEAGTGFMKKLKDADRSFYFRFDKAEVAKSGMKCLDVDVLGAVGLGEEC